MRIATTYLSVNNKLTDYDISDNNLLMPIFRRKYIKVLINKIIVTDVAECEFINEWTISSQVLCLISMKKVQRLGG